MITIKATPKSIRQVNIQELATQSACQTLIQEMRKTEDFLNDFGYLSFGRDFTMCGKHVFSLQRVITSVELTAGNVIACCESACIADANSLLRKYRDDLFFYLYVSVYNSNYRFEEEQAESQKNNTNNSKNKSKDKNDIPTQMRMNIENWIKNSLSELHIGDVLRAIGTAPNTCYAVKKYGLKKYFDSLGERLNDYVHSNGIAFYNLNINAYSGNELFEQLERILQDLRFITVSFLFLLTLCSPFSIMSTDYIGCLECGLTPEEGSQYWVAPFIERYFNENIDLIDESCLKYLKENTSMVFDK